VNDVWCEFVRTAEQQRFAVVAYCFMPDHLHVLAEGLASSSDLKVFVNIAKQRAAHAATRWIRGRLWQPGYFESVLRDDEDVHDVARYVAQNPVRAGLVRSANEYPFLGSAVLSRDQLVESTMWRPNLAPRKGAPCG